MLFLFYSYRKEALYCSSFRLIESSSYINCNQICDWWQPLISSNIVLYTQIYAHVVFSFINLSVSRRVLLYQVFIKQLIDANLPSVLHHVALKVHKTQYWNSIMKVNFTISASITGDCILMNLTPQFSWHFLPPPPTNVEKSLLFQGRCDLKSLEIPSES